MGCNRPVAAPGLHPLGNRARVAQPGLPFRWATYGAVALAARRMGSSRRFAAPGAQSLGNRVAHHETAEQLCRGLATS
eukprot:8772697-Alexandrium_andersonii.AAC.1